MRSGIWIAGILLALARVASAQTDPSTMPADTWLVAVPDIIRTRCLEPLAGFRWGYRLRAHRPELLAHILDFLSRWRPDFADLQHRHAA